MPYVRIDAAKNPYGMLNYLDADEGHNGNKDRNVMISYVNMDPEVPYRKQLREVWNQEKSTVKRHAYVIIQSFSVNELDPSDPQSYVKANLAGSELASLFGGGRQAVVFTQIDGVSGLVHNHIFINNVHPFTHRCFESTDIIHEYDADGHPVMTMNKKGEWVNKYEVVHGETYQPYVRELSDKVCANYMTLDPGLNKGRSYSHAEFALHEENKVIDAENDQITAENDEIRKYNKENPDKPKEEKALKPRRYVWKDDLRNRIDQAVTESKDWKDFVDHLDKNHHVSVREGKYITYTLRDQDDYKAEERRKCVKKLVKSGKTEAEADAEADDMDFTPKRKLSARSSRLGGGYSKEAVEERLKEKYEAENEKIIESNSEQALDTMNRQAVEAQKISEALDEDRADNDSGSSDGSSGNSSSGGKMMNEEKPGPIVVELDDMKDRVQQILKRQLLIKAPEPEKAPEPVEAVKPEEKVSERKAEEKPAVKPVEAPVENPAETEKPDVPPAKKPVQHGFVYIDVPSAMVSSSVTMKNGVQVVRITVPLGKGTTGEFRVPASIVENAEGKDKVRLKLRDDRPRTVHWKDSQTKEEKSGQMMPDRLAGVYEKFDERVKERNRRAAEKYDEYETKQIQDDTQYGG